MIDLSLTTRQARRVLGALEGPSVTNKELADIYYFLKGQLDEAEAEKASLPPWRKVVSKTVETETLECGHTYRLKYSTKRGCDWIEEHAKKRRCKECAKEQKANGLE